MQNRQVKTQSDVLIIGAGVLGVSLAYHLSRNGCRVIVLEREATPASHASGKNAGMVRQLYRNSQLTEWARRSIELWPKEFHGSVFQKTGSLIADRSVPAHHSGLFEQRTCHIPGSGEIPAVYTPGDGLLDSPNYVQQLYSACDKQHAAFHFRKTVTALRREGLDWIARTDCGEEYRASWAVNAAGAWVGDLLAQSHPELHVDAQPYARHLFVMKNWRDEFMPAPDCGFFWEERNEWYVRKWDQTSSLVSICERIPVSNPAAFVPRESVKTELAQKLLRALPDTAPQLRLAQSWHCFRTYTEDQLPIWGSDPRTSGLFWLAAFGGFGMSTSFAASYDAARSILGKAAPELPEFSVVRPAAAHDQKRAVG